jgi:hypothetical protein
MCAADRIVALYERAVAENPTNIDYLAQLFMAYVRVFDYRWVWVVRTHKYLRTFRKQQQTATQLHKLSNGKRTYAAWSIMSVLMQAEHAVDPQSRLFYQLAMRMADKMIEGRADMSVDEGVCT